jgi:hypothetical protein
MLFTCLCCLLFAAGVKGQSLVRNGVVDRIKPVEVKHQRPAIGTIRYPQSIPANFHTQHFGFFCRQELHLQRAGIPFAFRLGNMEQCNRLESK